MAQHEYLNETRKIKIVYHNNPYCYSYHLLDVIYWCHHCSFPPWQSSSFSCTLFLFHQIFAVFWMFSVMKKYFIIQIPNKIINSMNIEHCLRWHNLWLLTYILYRFANRILVIVRVCILYMDVRVSVCHSSVLIS